MIIFRIQEIKGEDDELPADFDNEIHKWALECWYKNCCLYVHNFNLMKLKVNRSV